MAADPHGPARAFAALIRRCDAVERMHADFAAFLTAHGVSSPDLEAMLAVGAPRFEVYRRLVHNRLRGTTAEFIERTHARVGASRFRVDFEAFMHDVATASPYLRDVPSEFVAWVAPRWRADPAVADYLVDLARHELLEYDLRNDPHPPAEPTGRPLALDEPLRFDGVARLMKYDFAVHRLSEDPEDRTPPEPRPTRLLVYRDAAAKVRYLELTPFAAEVTEALMTRRMAVAAGLRWACAQLDEPLDDAHLATAATFLADLAERGVMLGAESAI